MDKKLLNSINRSLKDIIEESIPDGELKAACLYAVFPGGKRIRPLITEKIAREINNEIINISEFSSCIELLHCSSLVHDDLPALDNDDFRRGKKSCHKEFSESTAILAGDTLIALAFKAISKGNASSELKSKLINLASNSFVELCQGQIEDLSSNVLKNKAIVHKYKTGALFRLAFEFGVLLSGMEISHQIDVVRKFGLNFGVYFQYLDDLADGSFLSSEQSDFEKLKIEFEENYVEIQQIFNKKFLFIKEFLNA